MSLSGFHLPLTGNSITDMVIFDAGEDWHELRYPMLPLKLSPPIALQGGAIPYRIYYEARNDCTNHSETIRLCNRCVYSRKINSQTIDVCKWRVHRHTAAQITK